MIASACHAIMPSVLQGGSDHQNIVMMRVFRILKCLRAIRMVRTIRLFRGLNLLVKARVLASKFICPLERLSAVESCKSNAKMRQEVSMALVLVLNMQCTKLCNSYFLNEPIFAFLRRCLWRQEVVPNSDDTSGLRLFLAIPLLVYASAGCFHVHWHPCDGQLTPRFCAGFDRQFRRQAW